jgi:hypothetical protein
MGRVEIVSAQGKVVKKMEPWFKFGLEAFNKWSFLSFSFFFSCSYRV